MPVYGPVLFSVSAVLRLVVLWKCHDIAELADGERTAYGSTPIGSFISVFFHKMHTFSKFM